MGVRKSVNFNVSLEAYEQVKEIFPEVIGTEDNLLQLVSAYKFWCEHKDDAPGSDSAELEKLRSKLNQAEAERDQIQTDCDRFKAEADTLEKELESLKNENKQLNEDNESLPDWDKIKQTIEPFPAALLDSTASMLSEYYGREVTPMQIMVDMFIRYTIERNAEWFYPFMLKDKHIVTIAKEFNPEVTDIRQIKKSLNLD